MMQTKKNGSIRPTSLPVVIMLLDLIFIDSFFHNLYILLPISSGMQQIYYRIDHIASSVRMLLSYFIFCYI